MLLLVVFSTESTESTVEGGFVGFDLINHWKGGWDGGKRCGGKRQDRRTEKDRYMRHPRAAKSSHSLDRPSLIKQQRVLIQPSFSPIAPPVEAVSKKRNVPCLEYWFGTCGSIFFTLSGGSPGRLATCFEKGIVWRIAWLRYPVTWIRIKSFSLLRNCLDQLD